MSEREAEPICWWRWRLDREMGQFMTTSAAARLENMRRSRGRCSARAQTALLASSRNACLALIGCMNARRLLLLDHVAALRSGGSNLGFIGFYWGRRHDR